MQKRCLAKCVHLKLAIQNAFGCSLVLVQLYTQRVFGDMCVIYALLVYLYMQTRSDIYLFGTSSIYKRDWLYVCLQALYANRAWIYVSLYSSYMHKLCI